MVVLLEKEVFPIESGSAHLKIPVEVENKLFVRWLC